MDAIPRAPFETLEICFRLLSTGPAGLALDGRRLGHGLPARPIPLVELRALLQHPTGTHELQRAVIEELVRRALHQGEDWVVGVAGVLLPGLRWIAASVLLVDHRAAGDVEAELLELLRDAIGSHAPAALKLALGVVQFIRADEPSARPMRRSDPIGA